MKNILRLLYTIFFLFIFSGSMYAQPPAGPPTPGSGAGTNTPEAAASPIDMYIPVLILAAVVFAIWYVRRNRLNNA